MKLCKDCRHWERSIYPNHGDHAGFCNSPKFQEEPDSVLRDGVAYWPLYDVGAQLQTGGAFGCIHWEAK